MSDPSSQSQLMMYVLGGAATGYFLGPSVLPDGTTAIMAAAYGAAAGYGVSMLMKQASPSSA